MEAEEGEKIHVAVRVRPVSGVVDDSPKSARRSEQQEAITLCRDGNTILVHTSEHNAASFRCDRFLDASISQDAVFEHCGAKDLVQSALDGFPVTIFAYGQVGSQADIVFL